MDTHSSSTCCHRIHPITHQENHPYSLLLYPLPSRTMSTRPLAPIGSSTAIFAAALPTKCSEFLKFTQVCRVLCCLRLSPSLKNSIPKCSRILVCRDESITMHTYNHTLNKPSSDAAYATWAFLTNSVNKSSLAKIHSIACVLVITTSLRRTMLLLTNLNFEETLRG